MIRKLDDIFVLDTRKTTYCFKVLKTGHLEHLYYGDLISVNGSDDLDVLTEKHFFAPGNTNIYTKDTPEFTLEDIRLEMSSYGKGDTREPFIEILHEDGGSTCDFTFKDYEITKGKMDDVFLAVTGKDLRQSDDTSASDEKGRNKK